MRSFKLMAYLLIGHFFISCGGSLTNSNNIELEESLTRVPNPVQQSLVAQAPKQTGAMVNTLLQFDLPATDHHVGLINFLKNSVISKARAAIGPLDKEGNPTNTLPIGSACDLIEIYGSNGISFLENQSGNLIESGSYGARTIVQFGKEQYNLEQSITTTDLDRSFCQDTSGNKVLASENIDDLNFDEEQELFASFKLSEKFIRCAEISSPTEIAKANQADEEELEIYQNVADYIALSGTGIVRTDMYNVITGDSHRVQAPMVVYGEFTFNNIVNGEVQIGENLGVSVNCTFAISAGGFFDPTISRCTDSNGDLVDLDINDDQDGHLPLCDFIANPLEE